MKCRTFTASLVLFLVGLFWFSSCYRGPQSYRKEYRDPALFGEWIDIDEIERMHTDAEYFENTIRTHSRFCVGVAFLANGDDVGVYAKYEDGSETPKLSRKYTGVYYTKGSGLYRVFAGLSWSAPSHIVQEYEVKGDTLYLGPQSSFMRRVFKRQKVTEDLLPKRPTKPSEK